jgi:PTH1 family peptidyl-tRNA hydrolase
LGNPGYEYQNTRHNIGFEVIDALAQQFGITLSAGKGEYLIGTKQIESKQIILMKPLTYMNNSGTAVKEVVEDYALDPHQLLVVVDDFNLPIGKIRFRERGSAGGHNGLYSIIYQLRSNNFPRLRCGIASDTMPKNKSDLADFVLSSFTNEEKKVVNQLIIKARDAVINATIKDLQTASNRFDNTQV